MHPVAVIPPASEIYAILGIVAVACAVVSWPIKLWLDKRYLSKAAYHAQRRDDAALASKAAEEDGQTDGDFRASVLKSMDEMKTRITALETEQKAVIQPLNSLSTTMQSVASEMRSMQQQLAQWRIDMETRLAVVEDRQKRSRRSDGGR